MVHRPPRGHNSTNPQLRNARLRLSLKNYTHSLNKSHVIECRWKGVQPWGVQNDPLPEFASEDDAFTIANKHNLYGRLHMNMEVSRFEGQEDRLERAISNLGYQYIKGLYPEGYTRWTLKSLLFGFYFKEAVLSKTVNTHLSPRDTNRCKLFWERFPEAQFEPLGNTFEVTYFSNTGEEYHIAPNPILGATIIRIPGVLQYPAVFLQGETVLGNSDRYETDYLLTDARETLAATEALFTAMVEVDKKATNSGRKINVYGADDAIELNEASHATWDDVFLAEDIVKAVKDDLNFFLNNEPVFREVGIPYKRGYLLTGPPGNGKSSICRVLATSMPFESFMFDFSNPDMGNNELTEAFKWATKVAPSVFFLEDIDRIFDPDTGPKTRVTMDHLLNCLDGIRVNDGLVVVATANNPKTLDSAILSRPGRFDKVVQIDVPDHKLRLRYLTHLFRKLPEVTAKDLSYMADETENVSMAFLKEVFVVTASRAIMNSETVSRKHIDSALDEILKQYGGISRCNSRKAGFSA